MRGLFSRKKPKDTKLEYDRETETPILRCSICNGEQVAGFRNRNTGRFREAYVIRSHEELEEFRKMCGVDQIPKEY